MARYIFIMRFLLFLGCDASFTQPSATITSPNYPGAYDNDLNCEYHITVEDGKVSVSNVLTITIYCDSLICCVISNALSWKKKKHQKNTSP